MKKDVKKLSEKIIKELKPLCKKIQIAGSIRRKELIHKDIDIILIPKDLNKLVEFMSKKGKKIQSGEHESTWEIGGVRVELYYTTFNEWGAALLAYSAKKGSAIGLRVFAKKKGFLLNNHGLFKGKKLIASKTEREIYKALGKPYRKPEDR